MTSISATLEAIFDPALGSRTAASTVAAGREPTNVPLVDPEDLEARRDTLPGASVAVSLAARGSLNLDLDLDLS